MFVSCFSLTIYDYVFGVGAWCVYPGCIQVGSSVSNDKSLPFDILLRVAGIPFSACFHVSFPRGEPCWPSTSEMCR